MLVLAMEFSRDARRPHSEKQQGGKAVRIRERPTVSKPTVGIATEVTCVGHSLKTE